MEQADGAGLQRPLRAGEDVSVPPAGEVLAVFGPGDQVFFAEGFRHGVWTFRGFLPAGSFPARVFGWGWTPTACRQGMPPARRGFVRGQENDRPDAAHSVLTVSRRPAGFCLRCFTHSPEHLLFRSLADVWARPSPQNAHGWPRGWPLRAVANVLR